MTTQKTDSARLGLAKEMLQVLLGLEPETMDRVMRTIKGSEDAADIKTMNMRKRIGARSMKYLRNAIDIARSEGDEQHMDDADIDMSKTTDMEPGHAKKKAVQPKEEKAPVEKQQAAEAVSFKGFLLNELNMDIDMSSPESTNDAVMKIKQAARLGSDRAAMQNAQQSKENMRNVQKEDPSTPGYALKKKRAVLVDQLAQIDKKLAYMSRTQDSQDVQDVQGAHPGSEGEV